MNRRAYVGRMRCGGLLEYGAEGLLHVLRLVCRVLDPAPPQLELTLARARGLESLATNALREMALQITRQPGSVAIGEAGLDPHSRDPSVVGRFARGEETGQASPNSAYQLSPRLPVDRAHQPTRSGGGRSIRKTQARNVAA